MNSSDQPRQTMYEILLSVGEGNDLTEVAHTALSTYLKQLDCSAGAVIEGQSILNGANYETVAMIPSRTAASEGLEAALNRIPDNPTGGRGSFLESLPISETAADSITYYLMELPDFGILILVTGNELNSETVRGLREVNKKLATACIRERSEAQLEAERDRYEALVGTIDEPLASVRPSYGDLLVQRINPAFEETFGYSNMQAVGHPLSSLLGSKVTEDDTIPSLETENESASTVTTEIQRETPDGMRQFLFRAAPIDPESDQTEYLTLLVEVTEESKRQRRLEQLNEVTNILSRILRHNIRNDLTVIKVRTEQILQETDGGPAKSAQAIKDTSEQLASTAEKAREIRQLVSMGKEYPSIGIETAIDKAVNTIRGAYPEAEITKPKEVSGDVTVHPLITHAIRHLVENGIEHHESNQGTETQPSSASDVPQVTISTEKQHNNCLIEIRDTGPGIPENEVEMLERTNETVLKHGSGAGLWIVGQVIEYCDAELDFSVDETGTIATITVDSRVTQ